MEVDLVSCQHNRYIWTEDLNRILQEGYKQGGKGQLTAVEKIHGLTGWPKHACYRRAATLGLAQQHMQYNWTEELDGILVQGYKEGGKAKIEAIRRIQSQTGWPRYVFWNRARKLQLSPNRRNGNRSWSETEDKYLLDFVGSKNPREIAKRLKRSVSAIRARLRHLGNGRRISIRVQDGHTKEELARYLGRSKRTIQNWIDQGWLKARYEGTNRNNDTLRVTDEDFRSFWKQHPWEVPFYKLSHESLLWFCSIMHDVPPAFTFGDPLDRKQRQQEVEEQELAGQEVFSEEVLDS